MKTSVSSYSFSYLMNKEGETQLSVIKMAKELGFDAIEFTDLCPPENVTQKEYAKMIKEEAERVGIEISCYSVSADLLSGSDGDLEKEIEKVKEKVDIAAELGVTLMRHDATFNFHGERGYRGFINVVDRLAEGCRKITEYAETKGIKTMVENHGFFCQDSDRVELLVNKVAHKNFGLLIDMGNFLCVDEDPAVAVGRCAPYAFNVHVKDFIKKSGEAAPYGGGFFLSRGGNYLRGTVAGHGVVPIKQCVRILKTAGYNGYLTLEFEGIERNYDAVKLGGSYIKEIM